MDLQISLTPQLEELIQQKIASGDFGSASEVVGAALRLMEAHDREQAATIAQLRQDIQDGLNSGAAVPWDRADIKALGQALRAAKANGES